MPGQKRRTMFRMTQGTVQMRSGRADYIDIENVPPEMTERNIISFLKEASIRIGSNQLEDREQGKWRIRGLMSDEVRCMMLGLVHDRKVTGSNGAHYNIKCCPVLTSIPEQTRAPGFNASAENSMDTNENLAGASPVFPQALMPPDLNIPAQPSNLPDLAASFGDEDGVGAPQTRQEAESEPSTEVEEIDKTTGKLVSKLRKNLESCPRLESS